APGKPIHGIMLVLEQIGRFLAPQPVGMRVRHGGCVRFHGAPAFSGLKLARRRSKCDEQRQTTRHKLHSKSNLTSHERQGNKPSKTHCGRTSRQLMKSATPSRWSPLSPLSLRPKNKSSKSS